MRSLLDVNALIALLYAVHMHHARANQWLQQHMVHGLLGHRGLGPATGLGCGAIAAVGRLEERLGQRWRIVRVSPGGGHRRLFRGHWLSSC